MTYEAAIFQGLAGIGTGYTIEFEIRDWAVKFGLEKNWVSFAYSADVMTLMAHAVEMGGFESKGKARFFIEARAASQLVKRNVKVLVGWGFGFLHPRRLRRVWFGRLFRRYGAAEDVGKLAQRMTGGFIEGIEGDIG